MFKMVSIFLERDKIPCISSSCHSTTGLVSLGVDAKRDVLGFLSPMSYLTPDTSDVGPVKAFPALLEVRKGKIAPSIPLFRSCRYIVLTNPGPDTPGTRNSFGHSV